MSSVLLSNSLGVDVLDDLRCVLMHNQFTNLLAYLGSKVSLVLFFWRVIKCFLGKMVGVLLGHQFNGVFFDCVDDLSFLAARSMLNKRLYNSASVMLENQVFVSLINNRH